MPDVSITRTTQMAGPSFCIGALLLLPLSGTSGIPGELDDGLATIEEETVEEFISLLASPRMQGRDTPSIGLDLALQEVVGRLDAAGLVPVADSQAHWEEALGGAGPPAWAVHEESGGLWLRPYSVSALGAWRELERPDPERCSLELELDDEVTSFEFGKDFLPLAGCPGDVRGELVFAGFGIESKRERYNDLKDLRLRGKVVMVLEGEPRHSKRFEGEEVTEAASLWEKLDRLGDEGVAAVILVRRAPEGAEEDEEAPLGFRTTYASWVNEPNESRPRNLPPAIEVTLECASALAGEDVARLARDIDRSGRPKKVRLDKQRVSLRSVTTTGAVDLFNVVGVVPGTGGLDGSVVVGAHADHIGVGPRGRIGRGADDNASGVSALCEIAEAMATAPGTRDVIFAVFTAEEDGLLGSAAFCAAPPVPTEEMVAMINLDMIGRGEADEVVVLGEAQNPGITKLLKQARKSGRTGIRDIRYENDPGLFQRSDHYSFHRAGVPTLFLFENYPLNKNLDYHTWRDLPQGVDVTKVTSTARLAFATAWILSTDEERLPPPRD